MRHWILSSCLALLAACSSAPTRDATPPVSTAAVAPAAAAAPAATAAKTASTPQGSAIAAGSGSMQVGAAAPAPAKARPGYKQRQRGGETVWCHSETPTGSRMPVEKCYTSAQLELMDASAESMKDTINKARPSCGSDARCGG